MDTVAVKVQPTVDWISRSVKRRSGYDVSEVITYFLVVSSDWPRVGVVNELATTSSQHIDRDGPLCTVCSVTLIQPQTSRLNSGYPKYRHWSRSSSYL